MISKFALILLIFNLGLIWDLMGSTPGLVTKLQGILILPLSLWPASDTPPCALVPNPNNVTCEKIFLLSNVVAFNC